MDNWRDMVSQTSKENHMYKYSDITDLIRTTEATIKMPINRYGISVYVEGDPDTVGPDISIDPGDIKGIALFREFAAKLVEHYKSLSNGSGDQARI